MNNKTRKKSANVAKQEPKPKNFSYFSMQQSENDLAVLFLTEEKRYAEALAIFDTCQQRDPDPRLILAKIKCLIGINQIPAALDLLIAVERVDWDFPQFLMLKGKALFELKEYNTAKMAFERCLELKPTQDTKRWIQRCQVYLAADNEELSRRIVRYEPQLAQCQETKFQPRHEWYQSHTHVTMVLYIKNVLESELNIAFSTDLIDIFINSEQKVMMHIDLAKNIVPEQSTYELTSKKIEIKMLKETPGKWSTFKVH